MDPDVCAVCLEPRESGPITSLPCGHIFHVDCIVKALLKKSSCPMCRYTGSDSDSEGNDTEMTEEETTEATIFMAEQPDVWLEETEAMKDLLKTMTLEEARDKVRSRLIPLIRLWTHHLGTIQEMYDDNTHTVYDYESVPRVMHDRKNYFKGLIRDRTNIKRFCEKWGISTDPFIESCINMFTADWFWTLEDPLEPITGLNFLYVVYNYPSA